MKEKKNIDRLFQEKFKNFEAHPSPAVWDNIVASQKEKDDRRVIPFWWKLGGIAAALLLLFGLGTLLTSSDATSERPATFVSTKDTEQHSEVSSPAETQVESLNSSPEIVASQNRTEKELQNTTKNSTEATTTTLPLKKKSTLTNPDDSQDKNVLANKSSNNKTVQEVNSRADVINGNALPNTTTAATNDQVPNVSKQPNLLKDNTKVLQDNTLSTSVAGSSEQLIDKELSINTAVSSSENVDTNKKDLIVEAEKIASLKNKEEVLPEELLTNDKELADRWGVGAVAAPVYYGDFGGSGIDPAFKDNDKTGNVNLSYGVQVSYTVTPKLKVRTGVSNVDLSYNTNDLAFSVGGTRASELEGVRFSQNARGVTVTDRNDRQSQAPNGFLPGPRNDFTDASVQQRLNYLEVPLEAVYTVSDKRFGVAIFGGVSTLLLNDNEVILLSEDLNTSLGTSDSANDVSFTTNIGVGLDYKITNEFKLNLEPALKYQINGFDDSAGEFKPYFLGVYTGLSYKF